MEYVPGGDLGKFIQENGPIIEPYVKIIAAQLVDALGYLHDNKITHRDVKPDNILIYSTDPLVVKLTDFGLSKMIDTEQTFLKTFCGTLLYCAPEVYTEYSSYDDYGRRTNRKGHRSVDRERYGHAVDIWSLGGVLFYTLTGNPPYPVQNGTTYTELLDYIIKTPFNMSPLVKFDVSKTGVHFLSRMIHVRPETRATIAELKSHAWLNQAHSVADQVSDEALGQSASQLSLDDRKLSQSTRIDGSSIHEPDDFMSFETEKENHAVRQPNATKLFGEVSGIGSSGVIPEERLNLPVPAMNLGDTEMIGSEVRDSFEESDDFSTPRDNLRRDNPSLFRDSSPPDNSRSALLGIGSQSLGGASSILKNLNMKSTANVNLGLTSPRASDLATSKRKPDDSMSDEHDTSNLNAAPSLKRHKSEGNVDTLEDEDGLLASVPQIVDNASGRQINCPVPKKIYWDGQDDKTWHLNYPEMTYLQFNAFERAAEKRKEVFGPGKTPLWELAMKYFPPSHEQSSDDPTHKTNSIETLALRPKELNSDQPPVNKPSGADLHPNLLPTNLGQDVSVSSEILSSAQTSGPLTIEHPIIGGFRSMLGSSASVKRIDLQDPVLSWGRDTRSNTVIHEDSLDSIVPKNAFRVLLWRDGYVASELRPWDLPRSDTSRTMQASPDPESYAFYIATKATNGLRINGVTLRSYEPKEAAAGCKYWMKLYTGDRILLWGDENARHAGLVFECSWGGSGKPRPVDEPPTYVPAPVAQKLDRLWPRAITSLQHAQIKKKAQIDTDRRMKDKVSEVERSRMFEEKRLEAIRKVARRQGLRGPSPLGDSSEHDPPTYTRAHQYHYAKPY